MPVQAHALSKINISRVISLSARTFGFAIVSKAKKLFDKQQAASEIGSLF
jgi:hypothetical protein